MKNQKYFTVTWEDIHRDSLTLANELQGQRPWKRVVAVTRGGLVPSALISRVLEVREIETVCLSSYDDADQQREIQIVKELKDDQEAGADWLVVDDLVDTGKTADLVKKMLPRATFVALYAKPMGKPKVSHFVTEIRQDTWIVFPWEIGEEELKQTQNQNQNAKRG